MSHDDLFRLLPARQGRFRFESGHHGDTWLELERLCLRPAEVHPFADELAARLPRHQVEVVCGPLVEGAFVALMVAATLDLPFTYAEQVGAGQTGALFPARYRLPPGLRSIVRGRRIAIVNDVVNAGSAVRGTFGDLVACG